MNETETQYIHWSREELWQRLGEIPFFFEFVEWDGETRKFSHAEFLEWKFPKINQSCQLEDLPSQTLEVWKMGFLLGRPPGR